MRCRTWSRCARCTPAPARRTTAPRASCAFFRSNPRARAHDAHALAPPPRTQIKAGFNKLPGGFDPSGALPPRLQTLELHANSLSGNLPQFSTAKDLYDVHLAYNQFTGTIPSLASNELRELSLAANSLTGTIPAALPSTLQFLRLSVNDLTGTIPPTVATLTDLETFSVHTNRLAGPVPSLIDLAKLTRLLLHGNAALTGPVPAFAATVRFLDTSGTALTSTNGMACNADMVSCKQ